MTALTMPPLALAAQKIAGFEDFSAMPYLDTGGIPTIGYGTIRYPDGRAVSMADLPITEAEALAYLEHDLTDTAIHLWKAIAAQPTVNQWSAMLSLAYNVGWPAIAKSTLVRLFNSGDPSASTQFLVWDKAHVDGQLVEVQGLLNRRKAEQALFLTPD